MDNLKELHKFLCTVKILSQAILQIWWSKSGAVADPHIYRFAWHDIFTVHRNLWSSFRLSKIGGDDVIVDYSKKDIRNLLHANIDVHSRRLIAEFPKDGMKCIEKLQSHFANITFSDKSRYDRTFQQVTHKVGGYAINYINRFQNAHTLSVLVGNSYSEDQLMNTFLDNFHQGINIFSSDR